MTDIAIRVEGLSKLYRIGPRERYRDLRDTLTGHPVHPFPPPAFRFPASQTSNGDSTCIDVKRTAIENGHFQIDCLQPSCLGEIG